MKQMANGVIDAYNTVVGAIIAVLRQAIVNQKIIWRMKF